MTDDWVPDDMAGQCFMVPVTGGQAALVQSTESPGPADAATIAWAVAEIRKLRGEPPPEAVALYARLDTARTARDLTWRALATEAGVRASVPSRLANGIMPDAGDRERLESWLSKQGGP